MSTGTRRTGRSYALQLLYARDGDASQNLSAAAVNWVDEFELEVDDQAQTFARDLVAAAVERAGEVDELIASASKNWRIDRMSRVDRNILRLGAYELLAMTDVPSRVTLNEAVELAKKFGDESSPGFVNGVLDRIASELPPSRRGEGPQG